MAIHKFSVSTSPISENPGQWSHCQIITGFFAQDDSHADPARIGAVSAMHRMNTSPNPLTRISVASAVWLAR